MQHNDRNNHARPDPPNKLDDSARRLLFWSWDVTHYVQTNDENHSFGIMNKNEGRKWKITLLSRPATAYGAMSKLKWWADGYVWFNAQTEH